MADKRTRHHVFIAMRVLHARGFYIQRLTNACVTDFAAVDDVVSVDADLVAEDRIIVISHLGLQTRDRHWPKTDQMILQIVVTFLRQFGWGRMVERLERSYDQAVARR